MNIQNYAVLLNKRKATYFLRLMIVIIGIGTLAFCIFALPAIWKEGSAEFPMASYAVILIVIGMYATAIPFFIGLWHTLKLLNYIDHDKAFSDLSVKALQNITWCATIIAILYICGVPLLFPIAQADDAPGLIIVGTVIACIPTAIAVFTSILQKLLKEAIETKATAGDDGDGGSVTSY